MSKLLLQDTLGCIGDKKSSFDEIVLETFFKRAYSSSISC